MKLRFIICFCFLTLIAFADNFQSKLKFYHLLNSNGLSQNTINCIHQDNTGFIWIGTNGGLSKWNGYSFTNYTHSKNDSTTVGQGRINEIYEDSKGRIWIGTFQGGLSMYNVQTNSFIRYQNKLNTSLSSYNNITQIIEHNGMLIIGTFDSGLFVFDINTKSFTPLTIEIADTNKTRNLSIKKLYCDNDSVLWVGHTKGLLKIHHVKHSINEVKAFSTEIISNQSILAISRTSKNELLIGSENNGIFCFNETNQKLQCNHKYLCPSLKNQTIRDFIVDKYNNLWIATEGKGVYIYNSVSNTFSNYRSLQNNPTTLTSDIIYCFAQDNNSNIWVGTFNGGVNLVNYSKQSFNHIRGYGLDNELNNNNVLSFCELNDTSILIGTDGGGLSVFNTKDQSISKFTDIPDLNNHGVVVCIKKDATNNIYIGTYKSGLFVYNLTSKKTKNYRKGVGRNQLLSNNIWAIEVDNNNDVWIGTLGEGISFLDTHKNTLTNYFYNPNDSNSLSNNFISKIYNTSSGEIWIATHHAGINILTDKKKGTFKRITSLSNQGLSSNEIWDIFEDSNNTIWVATHDGGLCKFDSKKNSFTSYTIDDGLPSNNIRSIIEDYNNSLWISSNKGISKVTTKNETCTFTNFSINHGLQGNEFNLNAGLTTSDNFLFFGGSNGFNVFHPDSIKFSSIIAPTVITSITALFHNARSNSKGNSSNIINSNTNDIKLSHDLSILTIECALLDYTFTETNQYHYKLEGYNTDWINNGRSRTLSFTNLDPGEYLLKIKGTNSFGLQNGKMAQLKITILPPIWDMAWFKAAALFLLIAAVLLIYWLRTRSLVQQQKKLEQKVKERTLKLSKLNQLLTNKNHEIELQSEELKTQREQLLDINETLENSNKRIEIQNIELEKHQNNLENLVKERTFELEQAKLKAEESEKLKMAFLANMSHEIRTPLNAIVGFSSLITDELYDATEKDSFANLINTNSNSLLVLIDDILDLSKIEANQLTIKNSFININELLTEIYDHWKIIKANNIADIDFELNLPVNNIEINSDKHRIKQIIDNLIDNAFKFTYPGKISIHLYSQQNLINIEVEDTGIGINSDNLNTIFDRFVKNEDNTNETYRGVGLGLTISKKLALLLNGDLNVKSKFGEGTCFRLTLPNN